MAAHEGRVLVPERHVDRRAEAAALLRRGHQCRALLDRRAQRRAELRMQDRRGVLELARLADDGRLAVALRLTGLDAEGLNALRAEQPAELLADGDQLVEVLDVAARARVLDHGHRERAARRRLDRPVHLAARLVDLHDELADLGRHGALPTVAALSAGRPTSKSRSP